MRDLGIKGATYNPLDFIVKDSPTAVDDCTSLANALVVTKPNEMSQDPHWNASAEGGIAGLIALTVYYGQKHTRSLQAVDNIANSPEALGNALKIMGEPNDSGVYPWDGMLSRLGGRMRLWQGDEKASVLSCISRHLAFLRTPACAAITRTSSFDPSRLVKGKMTVYIVPSLEYGSTMIGWVRMVIAGMLKAVMRGGLQEKNKVHFIFDEAAKLGPMEAVRTALDAGAGYGVRCQFYYQSVGQLNQCWPNGESQSLLGQTAQIYFGVKDIETATQVSNVIGDATVYTSSGGWNEGGSSSQTQGQGRSSTHGSSWSNTDNWSVMARKLLKPEEILRLHPRTAITFPGGGMPAVVTTLLRWYEEPWLTNMPGWVSKQKAAAKTLWRSAVALIVALSLAVVLTAFAQENGAFTRFGQSMHNFMKGGRR